MKIIYLKVRIYNVMQISYIKQKVVIKEGLCKIYVKYANIRNK